MSLPTLGGVPRPVSRFSICRSCENFQKLRKFSQLRRSRSGKLVWVPLRFFSQLRQSRSGKLVWVRTSPRVVRLIPRRARSISSLYGEKTNFDAKKTLFCNLKKKVPHNKRPWVLEIRGFFFRTVRLIPASANCGHHPDAEL